MFTLGGIANKGFAREPAGTFDGEHAFPNGKLTEVRSSSMHESIPWLGTEVQLARCKRYWERVHIASLPLSAQLSPATHLSRHSSHHPPMVEWAPLCKRARGGAARVDGP